MYNILHQHSCLVVNKVCVCVCVCVCVEGQRGGGTLIYLFIFFRGGGNTLEIPYHIHMSILLLYKKAVFG